MKSTHPLSTGRARATSFPASCGSATACRRENYEPFDALHDATTAVEDAVYMSICDGTALYFDDNGSTGYLKREVVEKRREKGAAVVAEAAE
jgi:hypothetical protein